eukprot:615887_1
MPDFNGTDATGRPLSHILLGGDNSHRCGYCKSETGWHSYGHGMPKLSLEDYQALIDRGWRRSGTWCYVPYHDRMCCPNFTIRLDVREFRASKQQKKVMRRFENFLTGKSPKSSKKKRKRPVDPYCGALRGQVVKAIGRCIADGSLPGYIDELRDEDFKVSVTVRKPSKSTAKTKPTIDGHSYPGPAPTQAGAAMYSTSVAFVLSAWLNRRGGGARKIGAETVGAAILSKLPESLNASLDGPPGRKGFLNFLQHSTLSQVSSGDSNSKYDLSSINHASGDSINHAPGDSSSIKHTSGDSINHVPGESINHASGDSINHAPGDSINPGDSSSINHASGDSINHAPGDSINHAPGDSINHAPDNSINHAPGDSIYHAHGDSKSDGVQSMSEYHAAHVFEIETVRSAFSEESYCVFRKYQMAIHKETDDEVSRRGYTRFLCDSPLPYSKDGCPLEIGFGSFHMNYRLDGKLIAVAVVDILPRCLSSVYFFYDPAYSYLNLGGVSAMKEIELMQKGAASGTNEYFHYYYMGFYIHKCQKMRYKGKYHPSQLLCCKRLSWHPLDKCLKSLEESDYVEFSSIPGIPTLPDLWRHSREEEEEEEVTAGDIVLVQSGQQFRFRDVNVARARQVLEPIMENLVLKLGGISKRFAVIL